MIKNKTLCLAVLAGLCFHSMGLYYLHQKRIHTQVPRVKHACLRLLKNSHEAFYQKQRALHLGEIVKLPSNETQEIKQSLQELKPEFSPVALVQLPEPEPFLIHDGSFTLDEDPLNFLSTQSISQSLFDSPQLLLPISLIGAENFPIMKDVLSCQMAFEGPGMLASTDHFDTVVEYTQRASRPGYIFKVTFTPKREINFKRIGHNFFFLIDRSNSIPRARFALNKEIVLKALEYLKPQDKFNIFLFDNKVCKLSEQSLSLNQATYEQAKDFLHHQSHGGYFAATELYSSLDKVIPENVSDQEVNTVILLSDGDTYLPLDKQRQTIGGWTERNKGKVSLYAVASGGGNNLPLLELISHFNKGGLVYTYDHRQLLEKVADLMLLIRNPIGKSMVATAVTADKQATITLQPTNMRMPELYQNKPFVIYGSTNKLTDFVLFLQGKYYDQRFDIKKKIVLDQAQLGSPAMEKAWTALVAQEFYERYFSDGNSKHIEAVRQLLAPLNIPVAFQEK
jgi:hypothetical protein